MQHRIPVERHGPYGPAMAEAVRRCVHCGFCLPACPTYVTLGQEMDSPRGRILLMKDALEADRPPAPAVVEHVDRCLGCLACVTACPAGVPYGDLLLGFRAWLAAGGQGPLRARAWRGLLLRVLPYPGRFRLAARLALALRPAGGLLPRRWRWLLELMPPRLPPAERPPRRVPARGRPRARVALLAGCVQRVLAPDTLRATAAVLAANGVEVWVPPGQGCCGALAWHAGYDGWARAQARRNLDALGRLEVDAVVVDAAGCGSAMRHYPLLFAGTPEAERAEALARRVRDVSEFLVELGPRPPGPLPAPLRVAYHDPCHLAHAQGIRAQPRRLLGLIPNLRLVELPEPDLCCGSAGLYNLEQPEVARRLGERKAEHVLASGADAVATGNVGCRIQLAAALRRRGSPVPVLHTVELLAAAYGDGGAAGPYG